MIFGFGNLFLFMHIMYLYTDIYCNRWSHINTLFSDRTKSIQQQQQQNRQHKKTKNEKKSTMNIFLRLFCFNIWMEMNDVKYPKSNESNKHYWNACNVERHSKPHFTAWRINFEVSSKCACVWECDSSFSVCVCVSVVTNVSLIVSINLSSAANRFDCTDVLDERTGPRASLLRTQWSNMAWNVRMKIRRQSLMFDSFHSKLRQWYSSVGIRFAILCILSRLILSDIIQSVIFSSYNLHAWCSHIKVCMPLGECNRLHGSKAHASEASQFWHDQNAQQKHQHRHHR